MSKKYEGLARDIVQLVGGKENVSNAYHCQTRLRFTLVDEDKADEEAIKAHDGVVGVIHGAGQFQVCIGPQVADVFEEVEKLVDTGAKDAEPAEAEKKGPFDRVIDFVAGTFQPIIPALSGAGMVKAVMALLVVFNLIDSTSQTYQMLNIFADGVFYFLPMLLAFTEAQKLKCNPILAAGVAAMMLHPTWSAFVSAGDPVNFFGVIPFTLASYGSSVIPIILVVFVQSFVEKWLNKHIPASVNLVFVPMLTFLVMGTLAFSILGPIGAIVGNWLAVFFTFLAENAAWVPAVLIGGLCPVMVMFGIHNGVAPLGPVQMAQLGYDSIWGPGNIVSNMCQATAGLVVAWRSKRDRKAALPGAITAFMGITEPILYGTNLPKKYPLVAAMIGGAVGGLYAGLTQTHRFATGSGGLPAVLLYIGGDDLSNFFNIIIAMVIGVVVTGVLTFFLSLKFEGKEDASEQNGAEDASAAAPASDAVEVVLSDSLVAAPISGEVVAMENVSDPIFASKAMGEGCAIVPTEGELVSPSNGVVSLVADTGHAVGIVSDEGVEVMMHVGIDTVNLKGAPFTAHVKPGDRVLVGQKLLDIDLDQIRAAGLSTETMVIITNTPAFASVKPVASGTVVAGEDLVSITAK
ncbi:beta-glucoside-specific PTS transporter subunit IIABC [Collinsella sp. An2]|uniref:beta-glucoside-specific PTS transporter subunit IIABC n=1 Tax=Collinsella sp. An2 TaxID=1965585 RepID=UPI000B370ECA|nr:beta-glucoside-specific PTS transporter subunit IIABC [Collinsella sp. An2]OUP10843.1 PTS beta-glucoside transporter subunit EIIBCA [Collinsella sp. An2]